LVIVLLDLGANSAFKSLFNSLSLEVGTARRSQAARGVHGALERIALPAKDVVGVLAETSVVARAEVEGLLDARGPSRLVVELGSVPDDLEHQLRDTNGVAGRAGTAQGEEGGGARGWVGNVVLVVGRIQVLAVPARGEVDVCANAAGAGLFGEADMVDTAALAGSRRVAAKVGARVAAEAVLQLLVGNGCSLVGVSRKHAEAGLEGRDLAGLGRDVVDEDAAVGLCAEAVVELVPVGGGGG